MMCLYCRWERSLQENNPELLRLVESLDALRNSAIASTEETLRLEAIYRSRINELLEKHPNLTFEMAERMIELAYKRWQPSIKHAQYRQFLRSSRRLKLDLFTCTLRQQCSR